MCALNVVFPGCHNSKMIAAPWDLSKVAWGEAFLLFPLGQAGNPNPDAFPPSVVGVCCGLCPTLLRWQDSSWSAQAHTCSAYWPIQTNSGLPSLPSLTPRDGSCKQVTAPEAQVHTFRINLPPSFRGCWIPGGGRGLCGTQCGGPAARFRQGEGTTERPFKGLQTA